jgi:hypothetical protein
MTAKELRLAPWIVSLLCLKKREVTEIEFNLNHPKLEDSMPEKGPSELTPEEREIQGLPAEPNVTLDASFTFNPEVNAPTSTEE